MGKLKLKCLPHACAELPISLPNQTAEGSNSSSMAATSALVVSLNVSLSLPAGFGLPDGPSSDAELAQALDGLDQVQALAGGEGGSVQLSLSAWAIDFKLNVTTLQSAGAQAPGGGGPLSLNPCAAPELEGLATDLSSLLSGPEASLTSAPSAACLLAAPAPGNNGSSITPTSVAFRRNLLIAVSSSLQMKPPQPTKPKILPSTT